MNVLLVPQYIVLLHLLQESLIVFLAVFAPFFPVMQEVHSTKVGRAKDF